MSHWTELPQPWDEAQGRAETYLRMLRGGFGAAEHLLVAKALSSARGQLALNPEAQPVTLVMEALFGFLTITPDEQPPMTPPLHRTTMLPESIAFPVHDWLGSALCRARIN